MIEVAWAAAGGLLIGSFLNVVILRLHAGRSFVTGRSACPGCGHQLSWWENLPVISYLLLKGRCRSCHQPISPQYPLIELLTGAVFGLLYWHLRPEDPLGYLGLGLWLYVAGSLIVLAVYDIRWYLLPDKVLLPVIVPALGLLLVAYTRSHQLSSLTHPLLAAVVFGGAFYLIAAVSQGRWMGGGDIKLAFVMGLCLGLQKTLVAMFLAFNAAAFVGVGLILAGLKTRKDYLPFGPFLIAATLVAEVWGADLVTWYVNLAGLNLL